MKKWLNLILILTCSVVVSLSDASPGSSTLKNLNQRIDRMQNELQLAKQQRSTLENELQKTEVDSGLVQIKLNHTLKQIHQQKVELKQLQQKKQLIQLQLAQQKQTLAGQLRSQYLLGNQPKLKLLLDQKNTGNSLRMLTYLHYLNQARSQTISNIQESLEQLSLSEQQLQQEYETLRHQLLSQKQLTRHYLNLRQQRRQLIQQIDRRIHTRAQKLAILSHNKQDLEKTVNQLSRNPRMTSYPGMNFSKLRGRLRLPTQGKILNLFGRHIDGSQLTWEGLLIKAPQNHPVYAIADGDVVFAKWLAGYGLLLIINHGHGYMTLYGRVHSLYKQVGQHVKAGDEIATVGQTGGFNSPALYFAMRHNAQPIDPLHWCR